MKTLRKGLSAFLLAAMIIIPFASALSNTPDNASEVSANDALSRLIKGNERFVSGKIRVRRYNEERPEVAKGQHPYAIVLACADSRVPPELLFDESLGKLFVIRVAGNVADPVVLGSIEYAVEHLHSHLLVVLGHDNCGAVKATISGGELPPNILSIASRIKPAVDKMQVRWMNEKEGLDAAIRENVHYQMQKSIFDSEILNESVRKKELRVVGGVYHLNTGRVEMVSRDLAIEHFETESDHHADHVPAAPTQNSHSTAKPAQRAVTQPQPDETAAPSSEHNAEEHPAPARKQKAAPVQTHRKAEAEHTEALQDEGKDQDFEQVIRTAYERRRRLMLTRSLLMRDAQDRCMTEDCQRIPAGEIVSLENPMLMRNMGRLLLKVRYQGKSCYIAADEDAVEITDQAEKATRPVPLNAFRIPVIFKRGNQHK
jgi:carbonic anhydrase